MSDALCHASAALVRFFFLLYFILFGNGMVQEQRSDANNVEMNGVKMQAVKDTKNTLKDWKKEKLIKLISTPSQQKTQNI